MEVVGNDRQCRQPGPKAAAFHAEEKPTVTATQRVKEKFLIPHAVAQGRVTKQLR